MNMSLFKFLGAKKSVMIEEKEVIEAGDSVQIVEQGEHQGLERIAMFCLLAVMFLLPIFFIPSPSFLLQFSKATLFSLLVLVAFSLWVISRLKDGRFTLPNSSMLIALSGVVGLFVISGFLSGSPTLSMFGQGFEVGTVVSILMVSLLIFLVPVLFRSKEQIFSSYLAFLVSFFFVALFHILRFVFGTDFLAFGIFGDAVSNTIGKWNDLGVFFGVSALLSLVTIELLSLSRFFKVVVYLSLITSIAFLAIVNFLTIWYVLGLFSLVFLVYLISFNPGSKLLSAESTNGDAPVKGLKQKVRYISVSSLIVLLVSAIFIFSGDRIGGKISETLGIAHIEARPSWSATFDVSKQTLATNLFFGAGPNQFVSEWLKYKPDGINTTIFWNVDFNYGVGLIPTFLATTGILGVIAWVLFFLFFLFSGFKAILSDFSDKFSQYLVTSSFFVALFLWIFSIFYIPSLTIFVLTFLFSGLFIASLTLAKMTPMKVVSFVTNPKAGFVSVLLLILLLIGGVVLGYALVQKYVASVYFQKGVISFNTVGNLDESEKLIARAASISSQDIYYRFLTELTLIRINKLLSQKSESASVETVRLEFQNLFKVALENANAALALNPGNYENLLSLGRVYEVVVPLKIAGAYENAKSNYEKALALNPKGPGILLTLARLEAVNGDGTKAKEAIVRTLREKNNYTEAIFLLSQIEVQEGNIKGAISSVEAAATLAPTDATVFFQLGLLRFTDKNYEGAAEALEKAVAINSIYANAKYFLGLSYDKLKRADEAIKQFSELKVTNPDNKEIDLILANLKAGRDPFTDAAPPADTAPEKRSRLPVEEKSSKQVEVKE